jgi:hypothetical protein
MTAGLNNVLKTVIIMEFAMMENVFVQKDSMEFYAKIKCVLTTVLEKDHVLMVNVDVKICTLEKVVK